MTLQPTATPPSPLSAQWCCSGINRGVGGAAAVALAVASQWQRHSSGGGKVAGSGGVAAVDSKSLHPLASECERIVPPYSPPVGYNATTPLRTRMTLRHPCLAMTMTMMTTTAGAASSQRMTRMPSRGGTTTAGRPSRGRSPSPGWLTSRWRRSGKRRW